MATERSGRGLCGNIIYAPQKIGEARHIEMVAKGTPFTYDPTKPSVARDCDLIMKRTGYITDVCNLLKMRNPEGERLIFERIVDIELQRKS